jgi:hypothetical protein
VAAVLFGCWVMDRVTLSVEVQAEVQCIYYKRSAELNGPLSICCMADACSAYVLLGCVCAADV